MPEREKEVKEEEVEAIEEKGKYQRAVKETHEEQEEELKLKIVKAKVRHFVLFIIHVWGINFSSFYIYISSLEVIVT